MAFWLKVLIISRRFEIQSIILEKAIHTFPSSWNTTSSVISHVHEMRDCEVKWWHSAGFSEEKNSGLRCCPSSRTEYRLFPPKNCAWKSSIQSTYWIWEPIASGTIVDAEIRVKSTVVCAILSLPEGNIRDFSARFGRLYSVLSTKCCKSYCVQGGMDSFTYRSKSIPRFCHFVWFGCS